MTDYQKAELKLRLTEALLPTMSKFDFTRNEVVVMAEQIWSKFIFKDIVDDQKKDSDRTSSGKK